MKCKPYLNFTLLLLLALAVSNSLMAQPRWTKKQASDWYKKQPWLVGANFIPSTAINQLEMWQAETFDRPTIDKELGWAENIGMNCMRVYLHHQVWEDDARGFKDRIRQYLAIANRHKIKTIFVFFDDCWNDSYKSGKQPAPKPGIHNSGWLKDPGNGKGTLPELEVYVKDMLKTFGKDQRILLWDLYNEPGQFDQHDKSLPLLKAVFRWAKQANPTQPLSSGMYDDKEKAITAFQLANSDVITYHSYDSVQVHQRRIDSLRKVTGNSPMICTEYMARKRGSTFQNILPMLKQQKVGAINWGLVDGKTQTKYAWDEKNWGSKEPALWFHDIFRSDGTSYDKKETDLIQKLTGKTPFRSAQWIAPGFKEDTGKRPCIVFQKAWHTVKPIRSAKLYITALGIYEATLNGKKVGEALFTPGFTNYRKRLQYQVYDVTRQLNATSIHQLKVTVADGWYRGVFRNLESDTQRNNFGSEAGLLAELVITYKDGTTNRIATGPHWQCRESFIRYAELYDGEFQNTLYNPGKWSNVELRQGYEGTLVPTTAQPVTRHERFNGKLIDKKSGGNILDFGQNLAGWVQLIIKGQPGDSIRISHAELRNAKGELFTANLRNAKAVDTYILNGKTQVLEPHFTYHGFRYAKLELYRKGKMVQLAIPYKAKAVALYTDLEKTGTFSCSNPLLNQLQSNIEWSMKSNFVEIPTDCPQRSERLGWLGDAQVFTATASFLRNTKSFYNKWLEDLAGEQGDNGALPNFSPTSSPNTKERYGVSGWSDAVTIMPSDLYQAYGDTAILRKWYPMIQRWVKYLKNSSPNGSFKNDGYGDWYAAEDTRIAYIDQCFYAHSVELALNSALILGLNSDAKGYAILLDEVKDAFMRTYGKFDAADIQTQTAYVLALQFHLVPEEQRSALLKKLVDRIRNNGNKLSTGFLGTPYLLGVLSENGYTDVAYQLLLQQACPSWLYPITLGATTIWERWDAIRPDGTIQETSFNHYSYGAIGNWLYQNVAGIQPAAPGYKQIRIAPKICGGLTWAKGSYKSKYGLIMSEWHIKNKQVELKVTVPKGTTAIVEVPGGGTRKVGAGKFTIYGKI